MPINKSNTFRKILLLSLFFLNTQHASWANKLGERHFIKIWPKPILSIASTSCGASAKGALFGSCSEITIFASPLETGIHITNTSLITAHNIRAIFPSGPHWENVTQTATGCTTVLPGKRCTLAFTFTTQAPAASYIPIMGDNTYPVYILFKFA